VQLPFAHHQNLQEDGAEQCAVAADVPGLRGFDRPDEGIFEHDEHVQVAALGAGGAGVAAAHEVAADPARECLLEDADHALEDLVGGRGTGRLQESRRHRPILPI
jgi:hypothetical protein